MRSLISISECHCERSEAIPIINREIASVAPPFPNNSGQAEMTHRKNIIPSTTVIPFYAPKTILFRQKEKTNFTA
jgi:hypothetical protein